MLPLDMLQELINLGLDASKAREVLEEHSIDRWYASHYPEVVVFAHSTEDVVKVMTYAHMHDIPVTTRGAGVGYVGGAVPSKGGIALSVFQMNEIIEVSTDDGVVVTQPGVITKDLQDAVKKVGWYYPPDPASLKECSIGGNIATNAGGPRCLKYGVTKHYVLGLTIVLVDGRILKTGGRLHKNKQGFDLTSLFIGSEGMLGVITEATLRLIPHPSHRSMLTATFEEFSTAALAVQTILNRGHHPSALEITDPFTLKAARDYLGQDAFPAGNAHLIIELDGRKAAIAAELPEVESILTELGALSVQQHNDEEACENIWQLRRDFSYSLRATGLTKLNEDIVVPRGKLVELVEFAQTLSKKSGIPISCFGHAGDGNIHTNLMVADYNTPEIKENADAALNQLFSWILENDGAITGEHGVGLAKKKWFKQAVGDTSYNVHQELKRALDPKDLLNPEKFIEL